MASFPLATECPLRPWRQWGSRLTLRGLLALRHARTRGSLTKRVEAGPPAVGVVGNNDRGLRVVGLTDKPGARRSVPQAPREGHGPRLMADNGLRAAWSP